MNPREDTAAGVAAFLGILAGAEKDRRQAAGFALEALFRRARQEKRAGEALGPRRPAVRAGRSRSQGKALREKAPGLAGNILARGVRARRRPRVAVRAARSRDTTRAPARGIRAPRPRSGRPPSVAMPGAGEPLARIQVVEKRQVRKQAVARDRIHEPDRVRVETAAALLIRLGRIRSSGRRGRNLRGPEPAGASRGRAGGGRPRAAATPSPDRAGCSPRPSGCSAASGRPPCRPARESPAPACRARAGARAARRSCVDLPRALDPFERDEWHRAKNIGDAADGPLRLTFRP